MLVLYAGLGREMAIDYDHRSCILLGAGQLLLASATTIGRVEEPETHIKRQATRHYCLPRLDEPNDNEPTKEEPLSLVLFF
jgi:hypothetical protein